MPHTPGHPVEATFRAGVPSVPPSEAPPQRQPRIGQLAQPQPQNPLEGKIGPPKDDADLARRQTEWESFFSRPETIAGLLQFASMVSGPNAPGQSELNQIINAIGGGFQAAGRVSQARAASEAAGRAETREERRLRIEEQAPIRAAQEAERGRQFESTQAGLGRIHESAEARAERRSQELRETLEPESERESKRALAELRRAQAAREGELAGENRAARENAIEVAKVNAAAKVEAAIAGKKGRLPEDRNEYVILATQEMLASDAETRLPNEVPLTTTEARRRAEELADTLPRYREQKQTSTRAQAMQDFNDASPTELEQLRRDQSTLEASARFLGVSTQELNRMIDEKKRRSLGTGIDTGAPQQ